MSERERERISTAMEDGCRGRASSVFSSLSMYWVNEVRRCPVLQHSLPRCEQDSICRITFFPVFIRFLRGENLIS